MVCTESWHLLVDSVLIEIGSENSLPNPCSRLEWPRIAQNTEEKDEENKIVFNK